MSDGLSIPRGIEIPAAAFADPREELIVIYTVGHGTFSQGHKYVTFEGQIHQLDETADGHWSGIYEFQVPLGSLFATPKPAPPPYNRPQGPMAEPAPQAFSKGRWTFADGSSISVVGPAVAHAVHTSVLDTGLWLSANTPIAEGSGRFEGALGTKTSGVSMWIPQGTALADVQRVEMKSLDAFRVIKKEFIGEVPANVTG